MLKREEILRKAAKVVMCNGYANTRLEDVAHEIGVTRPNLYYHFRSKEDLVFGVLDFVEGEFNGTCLKILETETDPIHAILHLVDRFTLDLECTDYRGGCVMGALAQELAGRDEHFRQRILRFFELIKDGVARSLRQGQARGYFQRPFDPEKTARWILATIQGCLLLSKTERKREYMEACRESILNNLQMLR